MKKKNDIIQIVSACAIVLGFFVAFWALPDKDFSDKENRTLEQFPAFTLAEDKGGGWAFTSAVGKYFADQFPLRDFFVGTKAYCELALGRLENNDVIMASVGTLVPHADWSEAKLERNLRSVSVYAEAKEIPVTLACLPRPCDVFADRLPAVYDGTGDREVWGKYTELCKKYSLDDAGMYSLFTENGEYYRTDHHYTTDGAYSAYCALGGILGYTPYPEDFFDRQTVSFDFEGTSMRTSGFYLTEKDEIVLYRYDGDDTYEVNADGEKISLYDFDKLNTTDKYAVFLGGNHARVDITSGTDTSRQRLLLVRDSYADAVAPFLALHYDLTLIDPRYYTKSTQSECDCDAALIYMGMNELSGGISLGYLEMP